MNLTNQKLKILKWTTRILSLIVLLFGLPFYFGYGNPLPFINPDYTLWDNVWLSIFPIIFIGLALGWKYEKIAGYLIMIPLALGMLLALITWEDFAVVMFVPLALGVMYLVVGYNK